MARTVRVFHQAILELADDERDGIGFVMDDLAEEIRAVALDNARVIIPNLPEDFLQVEAGRDTRGLFFRIHTDGGGHFSRYLAQKEAREHVWFEPAVAEVVGAENLRTPLT